MNNQSEWNETAADDDDDEERWSGGMTPRARVARLWRFACAGVLLALLMLTKPATALPSVGETLPELNLIDAWDQPFALNAKNSNKPVLVVYEDKDSSGQNAELKRELARLAKGDRYRTAITLLAIADVTGYDYWPIRGFVKDAIKDESHKVGTRIFCDWNGATRSKMGVRKGQSNVVLYGKDGRVLLSHEGPMPAAKRARLIALLGEQINATS